VYAARAVFQTQVSRTDPWMLTAGEGLQQSVVRLKGDSEPTSMAESTLRGR